MHFLLKKFSLDLVALNPLDMLLRENWVIKLTFLLLALNLKISFPLTESNTKIFLCWTKASINTETEPSFSTKKLFLQLSSRDDELFMNTKRLSLFLVSLFLLP